MNTVFNKKDVASFGQHVANWIKNGMILKNEKGEYPVNESDVDNWILGVDLKKSFHCPKAQSVAQEIMARGVTADLDREERRLKNCANTYYEARENGVIIAIPWVDKLRQEKPEDLDIVFGGYKEVKDLFDEQAIIQLNGNNIPTVKVKFPHCQFPVFENGQVIAIGVCAHRSDIPGYPNKKPQAVSFSPQCG